MIWRLEHPVRGLAAAVALWFFASWLIGFGVGVLEFAVLIVASVGIVIAVGGRSDKKRFERA